MMHRWTTRGCVRMNSPGAQPRHLHFEGRAVHDVIERAWLKNFIEGWLARVPRVGHVGSRGIAATRNFPLRPEGLSKFPNVIVSLRKLAASQPASEREAT